MNIHFQYHTVHYNVVIYDSSLNFVSQLHLVELVS